jgi:hypothetical protein
MGMTVSVCSVIFSSFETALKAVNEIGGDVSAFAGGKIVEMA